MSATRLAPVALALLLVLAGCGGGAGPGTPTATTATANGTGTEYSVTVTNGSLPVDANRTFARVQSLMGTDVEPRPVEIKNLSEWRGSLPRIAAAPINDALGFENVSVDWDEPTGATKITGYVYIHPGTGSAQQVERVLAHELAHSVQFQANMFPWLDELRTGRVTTDEVKVYRSLQEGGAVYVADSYTQRYLDVQNNSVFVSEYMTRSPTHWSALAPYYYGNLYLVAQTDSPANISAVYENRPTTTEQILHNQTASEEPPANLTVETNASHPGWQYAGNNTLGEMTTRGSLGTELNRSRAAAAAAGWGTDELTIFQTAMTEQFGWVWVHRWDSSAEADEAATALDTYATRRGEASERAFRTVRVDEKTTALVFGPAGFVADTTVSASAGSVSVAVTP